ncbi:MAG: hypothetical protein VYB28_01460 [Gemmatimonadota bacterium]|nr:hypothetical protein [Gemmatimonadota bacterium]
MAFQIVCALGELWGAMRQSMVLNIRQASATHAAASTRAYAIGHIRTA